MVPLGFILLVLVPAISFALFFSLVRPHHVPCFDLGPFLRFLVTGLSLIVPSVVGGDLPDKFIFVPITALRVSLSHTVAFFFRSLSLSLSLRVIVLLSTLCLGPLSFLSLRVIQFPYTGFPFRSCCGYAFMYSRY